MGLQYPLGSMIYTNMASFGFYRIYLLQIQRAFSEYILSAAEVLMKLFVVRHGETEYNVQGRYAGSTDVSLNARGFGQAERLAEELRLESQSFDTVAASPMLRARQTAEIICNKLNLPMIICENFSERNVGVYEGLTRREAAERYPDLWERQCTGRLDDAPTDGETIRQVLLRVSEGLAQLKAMYPDGNVLLVCHGFASRAVNKCCTDIAFEEMHKFSLGNCEIAEYIV